MERYIYRIYFLVAILTSLFYTSNPVGEKGIIIGLIPFFILVITSLIFIIKNKDYRKINSTERNLILLLLATYVISALITRGFSFRELYAVGAIVIGICVCGSIILSKNSKQIIKMFLEMLIVVSTILSLFGVYCHTFKKEIWIGDKLFGYESAFGSGTGGILSIMQNVNSFALVCVVASMISIILIFMSNNKLYKIIMGISAIFQASLLFVMASRTTLLMLAAFVGFYFIFFYKSKYKKYLYILGIIAMLFLAYIIFSGKIPAESALWYKMFNGDITSGRLELWKAAIVGIKENLFFGVGIRNVIETISVNMGNMENELGAHNGYISVLLANGLVMFTSMLVLIGYYISSAWVHLKSLKGNDKITLQLIICFSLSMLVGNLTESSLFGDFNFAVVILWVMLVIGFKFKKDRSNNRVMY